MLKDAVGSVVEMGRKSDAQTRAAANGKATWSTWSRRFPRPRSRSMRVVAVRDRVIQAYEEIMKMPI